MPSFEAVTLEITPSDIQKFNKSDGLILAKPENTTQQLLPFMIEVHPRE